MLFSLNSLIATLKRERDLERRSPFNGAPSIRLYLLFRNFIFKVVQTKARGRHRLAGLFLCNQQQASALIDCSYIFFLFNIFFSGFFFFRNQIFFLLVDIARSAFIIDQLTLKIDGSIHSWHRDEMIEHWRGLSNIHAETLFSSPNLEIFDRNEIVKICVCVCWYLNWEFYVFARGRFLSALHLFVKVWGGGVRFRFVKSFGAVFFVVVSIWHT